MSIWMVFVSGKMSKTFNTVQSSFESVTRWSFSYSRMLKVPLNRSPRHKRVPVAILSGSMIRK